MNIKRFAFAHSRNIRDMGGYLTCQGKPVPWKRLLRAGGLHRLTSFEWSTLYQYGVRTIIDLRSRSEAEMAPDAPIKGINYLHLPLQKEELMMGPLSEAALSAFIMSMKEGYQTMVHEAGVNIVPVLQAIREGLKRGAVLFHCTAGKDRTGIMAAILYSLLGVEHDDIIADYCVTSVYTHHSLDVFLANIPEKETIKACLASHPATMECLLEAFDRWPLTSWLAQNGWSEIDTQELVSLVMCPVLPRYLHLRDREYPYQKYDHVRPIARAVVFNDQYQIALIKLQRDDLFGQCELYELPGGGVDDGESYGQAVLREIQEETGCASEIVAMLGIVEDDYNLIKRHNVQHYYLLHALHDGTKHLEAYEQTIMVRTEWVDIDQAIRCMEAMADHGLPKLVKNRELPILRHARKIMKAMKKQ